MEIAILINNQHIHGFVRAVIIENTLAHQVSLGIKIAEIAVHRQHRIVSLRDERRLIRAAGIDLIGQRRAQLIRLGDFNQGVDVLGFLHLTVIDRNGNGRIFIAVFRGISIVVIAQSWRAVRR